VEMIQLIHPPFGPVRVPSPTLIAYQWSCCELAVGITAIVYLPAGPDIRIGCKHSST
jgi:hypothetical protein